jgi:hypothetical protein
VIFLLSSNTKIWVPSQVTNKAESPLKVSEMTRLDGGHGCNRLGPQLEHTAVSAPLGIPVKV